MTLQKEAERPSCLSRGVLRVFRKNETENTKLHEKLKEIEREERQSKRNVTEDMYELRRSLIGIGKTKEKMRVSGLRRKFFADHGYVIQEKHMDISEFLTTLDKVIYEPIGKRIPLGFKSKMVEKEEEVEERDAIEKKDLVYYEEMKEDFSDQSRPYQFRKIVPPLNGRKVEEIYDEIKLRRRKLIKMKDFKNLQLPNTCQISFSDIKQENERRWRVLPNAETSNEDEGTVVTNLKNSLDQLLINGSVILEEATRKDGDGERKIRTQTPTKGQRSDSPTQRISMANSSRNGQMRPLSCPPEFENKESGLKTRRKGMVEFPRGMPEEGGRPRKAWGDSAIIDNTNEVNPPKRNYTPKQRPRPKSSPQVFVGKQVDSPPAQRKISTSRNEDIGRPVRKISYSNGFEVEKEIVYDARPRDAMTSGYSTLQRTVGKKSVKVYVPKFKNKLASQQQWDKNWKLNSDFEAERNRIKRLRNKIELDGD